MSHPDPHPLATVSSPDHNAERLAALKQLFPDLFTNEGRLNVDELKKVVDPALVSETERYDFRWYGKTRSKREAFTPSRAALVYDAARSVNPEKAGGNMIIEGENIEFTKNEVFLAQDAHKESLICLDHSLDAATVDHFKKHTEHFFICLELALDTTKKWNLKHHLGDKLKAF